MRHPAKPFCQPSDRGLSGRRVGVGGRTAGCASGQGRRAGAGGETRRAAAENARGRARRALYAARRLEGRRRDFRDHYPASAQLFRVPVPTPPTFCLSGHGRRSASRTIPTRSKSSISTIALQPDWAEGWNARATTRYLDDDYKGSMADIAQTLKRDPKHLGALMGMGMILEAREKREDALKVYVRVLRSRRTGATPKRRPTSSRRRWPAASFSAGSEAHGLGIRKRRIVHGPSLAPDEGSLANSPAP